MNGPILWYAARSTGIVSLLLLTGTVLLGVLGPLRVGSPAWPRFALAGLHRNISLLTLAVLGVHAATVVVDSYVPFRPVDAFVPFLGAYQPLWTGLGVAAFDVLIALVVTSLLRQRINLRLWRSLHWLAYLCWPLSLIHALGGGTDAAGSWPLLLGVLCALAVLAAVIWRIAARRRLAGRVV
ncbi:ferric reductase-like transmembrane domain-containing protein [Rhizomonospora bruguierae]|uniref:ferric reductase-like transmembrane domain-containing protein n=1 Tax=Rhizomonospora bruguierae TaxID=1581705 RepID=UPI001BCAA221|nr:ferric reductase-like transmembrane domain-containing protein [Micromonospora sp. NBRC 107566]